MSVFVVCVSVSVSVSVNVLLLYYPSLVVGEMMDFEAKMDEISWVL